VAADIVGASRSLALSSAGPDRGGFQPLRLRGVGSGSVVPLDGDRLARWARAGAGRLEGVPVTSRVGGAFGEGESLGARRRHGAVGGRLGRSAGGRGRHA
jgi:hypothetical protein